MCDSDQKLRQALMKIAEVAQTAVDSGPYTDEDDSKPHGETTRGSHTHAGGRNAHCSIKQLPDRLVEKAAKTAISINPVNRVSFGPIGAVARGLVLSPAAISVLVGKYWGPQQRQLTVSFLDGGPSDLRRRIIQHMNAWNQTAGISFVETRGVGKVRISRNQAGYWSYLGTDILHIPSNRPTLNLQGFTMNMPEREFHRVVRHEAGHTLGFPHEHMREELVALIDPEKAYDFFLRTQGWSREMVDQQVLTPLSQDTIMGTPPDQDSIMCYQLPGSITKTGEPIRGGIDINATDAAFAGRIYPKVSAERAPSIQAGMGLADEWSPSEDVEVDDELVQ
ncbi:M12 family metallopeptidase [Bradyrhizobium sp. Arg237L]|uniref:M12 family metallopeptidase n=1 Tax=Bradyrhizobium sp. Arg237L TaxID=3003352 RepID=UPI00249F26AF|nr:M12 family metallopeptidase [Bradyrhizobium sp. Arg237L]MDI4232176.1 M12 family metallopeptidase [Bradyrhizobium sp. Arg237L]